MQFLYNIAIAVYSLLIRFAALFNAKAGAWVQGRKAWRKELAEAFADGDKIVWFHAASLGEFEQGRPVMEAMRKTHPDHKILLTFYSPSGYSQKKNYSGADKVMYLPQDCKKNASYFVRTLQPNLAIFIKYEFWFNYLSELEKLKVPTVFISAVFRRNQLFFKWYGGWFRKRIKAADHFFVQDEASADMLKNIGIQQCTVSGDTRFDRVADILGAKTENKDVESFCAGNRVLLAGSTWPPDESIITPLMQNFPDLKLIIAPHEVKDERVDQLIDTLKLDAARYTRDDPESWVEKRVLVIDTIGVLSSIYRYADIAYIGGAFGSGLHNIQEPAVNGMPVIFGPKYNNFREAVELVESEGAFAVHSSAELKEVLNTLLTDDDAYRQACDIAKRYMLDHTGATEKIMRGLGPMLS